MTKNKVTLILIVSGFLISNAILKAVFKNKKDPDLEKATKQANDQIDAMVGEFMDDIKNKHPFNY